MASFRVVVGKDSLAKFSHIMTFLSKIGKEITLEVTPEIVRKSFSS